MSYILEATDIQVDTKFERFKKLREFIGGSQIDFAKRWGIDQPSLSKIEKGERNIGRNLSKSLISAFNVNPVWWEIGEGKMIAPAGNVELQVVNDDEYEGVWLPFYPIRVLGSFIDMSDPEMNYGQAEKIRVIIRRGEDHERNVVFEVEGDSMEPKYSRGTKIRCKMVNPGDWEYLSSGVYAISYGDSFVVKRIKDNDLLTKGFLTLHSDNPNKGGSTPVPVDQLHHIWKVLRIIDSPAD